MGMDIESLRVWLLQRGYTPGSIKHVLTLARQLGRWMAGSDVKFSQLDSAAVDSEGLLAFGLVPDSPVEQLVAEYRTWLVVDRGLAAPTVLRRRNARRFVLRSSECPDRRFGRAEA
jgi:hypothetical protein